jgi:hypothetical protein
MSSWNFPPPVSTSHAHTISKNLIITKRPIPPEQPYGLHTNLIVRLKTVYTKNIMVATLEILNINYF